MHRCARFSSGAGRRSSKVPPDNRSSPSIRARRIKARRIKDRKARHRKARDRLTKGRRIKDRKARHRKARDRPTKGRRARVHLQTKASLRPSLCAPAPIRSQGKRLPWKETQSARESLLFFCSLQLLS